MAYNSKTRTITVDEGSEFMLDAGYFFVDMLRKDAISPDSPTQMKSDWTVLETWLRCAGRELSDQDGERIRAGWKAYFGIGLAPSRKLQPVFKLACEQYKQDGFDHKSTKPPTEVIAVFDRMLATDDEIHIKRKEDWAAEKVKFEPIFKELRSRRKVSWWRRQSEGFRRWAFFSVAWAVLVFLFVAIFDPFNNGRWRYMEDEEYLQMFTVMAVPLLAGATQALYAKWVK